MLSADLRGLCAALSGDFAGLQGDAPRQVRLVELAQRHRVAAYLHATTPAGVWQGAAAELLEQSYRRNTHRVLIAQSWTERLIGALAADGIEARPLKGLPLAAQAYARISDRHCGDIDLLIADVAQREGVERRIGALGMRRSARAQRLPRVHSFLAKSDEFIAPDNTRLEVHFLNHREARAMHPAHLAFQSDGWEAVNLGSLHTHRLRGTPLLLYLLSHGLRQGWLRLKWLLDLRQLTRGYGEREWAALRDAAALHDFLPEFRTGAGLLHRTLGQPAAPPDRDALSALLQSICLRWLDCEHEPTAMGTLKLLKPPYKMLALSGFWPRVSYLSALVLR